RHRRAAGVAAGGERLARWAPPEARCARLPPRGASGSGRPFAAYRFPPRGRGSSHAAHRRGRPRPAAEGNSGDVGLGLHQCRVLEQQRIARLDVIRIVGDAVDRADLAALRRVEMADALGAARGIDHVDLLALRDRVVRALGLANVAVDALVGDDERHRQRSRATRAARRAATDGWTKLLTSPPKRATSRTIVAEMNMYCSEGVRNSVSTSG